MLYIHPKTYKYSSIYQEILNLIVGESSFNKFNNDYRGHNVSRFELNFYYKYNEL